MNVLQVFWTNGGHPTGYYGVSAGFQVEAGAPEAVSLSLYCTNGTGFFGNPVAENWSVSRTVIDTAGFGLVATDAPLTWSSGTSGASAAVQVTVSTPSYAYTGNLTIELH